MDDQAKAWRWFRSRVVTRGHEAAVAWLKATDFPEEVKAATVARAARENLEMITITQHDLTSNRRRPGAFE